MPLFDRIIGEVFFNEIDLVYAKLAAFEIIEDTGIGGEGENKAIGIERLSRFVIALVEALAAVFAVAQQRPARMRHLRADLVRAPGQQVTLDEREPAGRAEHTVFCNGCLGAGLAFLLDVYLVFDRVLEKIIL